jgi:hypothetical protein
MRIDGNGRIIAGKVQGKRAHLRPTWEVWQGRFCVVVKDAHCLVDIRLDTAD